MKRFLALILSLTFVLGLFGCSKNEPTVVQTYAVTVPEAAKENLENDEFSTTVKYYEMSDGTWKTDEYTYKYRLEITGRMNNAAKDSTYIILSNTKDITFEKAWKASGFSSLLSDYFEPQDSIIVAMK